MTLTGRNLLLNTVYYGITVVALPAAFLTVESMVGVERYPSIALKSAGAVMIVVGAALQVWSVILLQRAGRGTPSPAVPTRELVTSGPYRRVRNPLNIGEMLVFLGMAAWFGSLFLLGYAAAAFLAFHMFIVWWEEPRHRREFGEAYEAYRARVPRWLPM